jgi:hypothetical protein
MEDGQNLCHFVQQLVDYSVVVQKHFSYRLVLDLWNHAARLAELADTVHSLHQP